MIKRLKSNPFLGLYIVLLILIMTACGKSQSAAPETVQESKTNLQIVEPLVIPESEGSESSKAEETASEEQGQSSEQEDTAETQDNSEANKTPLTDESETQGNESESQVSEIEDAQETINDNLPVRGNYYYDVVNVVLYLDVYNELPPNYITKSEAQALGWEGGSVEKYKEGAAIGGDYFGNREGLLPADNGRKYTECDIDTHGYGSRGSRRLVFSNDGLYFYTSNHYESFSEVTVTENYEVIW